ncbi:hypothetical protein AGMMS49938_17860 [Fibrobacterales bacterium]|nr:hypothetical protein AGMMS49938_17860 [Fibrobacterales bacterium]
MLFTALTVAEDVCGIIDLPTTWTKEHSPYRITGDVQIAAAARLTIEAGVEVLVATGEACGETKQIDWSDSNYISIKAFGPLVIKGTAKEPVKFSPENPIAGKVQWDGIRLPFKDKAAVQIEFLHISGANKAINASYGKFNVGNSLFIGNGTGIWAEPEANLSVYNCIFTENLSAGIYIKDSRVQAVANIFYKNSTFGILSDSRLSPKINSNIFFGNSDTDCRFCPVGTNKQNIFKDPIFSGSATEKALIKKDPSLPTPAKNIKDTVIHKIYTDAIGDTAKTIVQATSALPFSLSKYSPALNAAPNTDFFKNNDGSQGDIGLYGGKTGRYNKEISY